MMTREDPIVAEVRRIRQAHSAKYGGDVGRICAALRQREQRLGRIAVKLKKTEKRAQG